MKKNDVNPKDAGITVDECKVVKRSSEVSVVSAVNKDDINLKESGISVDKYE